MMTRSRRSFDGGIGSRRSGRRSMLVPLFSFALLVGAAFFLKGYIFSAGAAVAMPLWANDLGSSLSASAGSLFTSRDSLAAENAQLKSQLADVNYRMLAMRVSSSSTAMLAVAAQREVEAKVLVRPGQSLYDTLVIGAGSEEGVGLGDIALAADSVALGAVTSIASHTSVVTLYSAPGKITDVIVGSENAVVPAEGQGGGGFMAKVPQGVPVAVGDIIALPHQKPIAFAKVDAIDVVPADPFKKVYFQEPANIYTLQAVTLVKP